MCLREYLEKFLATDTSTPLEVQVSRLLGIFSIRVNWCKRRVANSVGATECTEKSEIFLNELGVLCGEDKINPFF